MHSLFEDVELLARLLMVCPARSCEVERSFSAMCRLKTWLRNSTSQVRLNAAAVCHIHKDRLDSVSDTAVAAEFAGRTATRRAASGHYAQE